MINNKNCQKDLERHFKSPISTQKMLSPLLQVKSTMHHTENRMVAVKQKKKKKKTDKTTQGQDMKQLKIVYSTGGDSLISQASKIMFKILQARLQYVNG